MTSRIDMESVYESARTERARFFALSLAGLFERMAKRLRNRAATMESTPSRAR